MLSFRAAVETSEKYWFFQIMAMFVFTYFVALYGTILTAHIMDRIRRIGRKKGADNSLANSALRVRGDDPVKQLDSLGPLGSKRLR